MAKSKGEVEQNEELLREIRETHETYLAAWHDQREAAKGDTRLMANQPFTDQELKKRKNQPLYAVDSLGQYTNQIVNSIRQNPRGVNVSPKDLHTGRKEAEQRGNLFRGIEKESDAQAAYCTGFEGAVCYGGMGYLRLDKDYEDPLSSHQVLRINRVPDPTTVLPDPHCKKIDYADMGRCFVDTTRLHSEFLAEYPGATIRSFSSDMQRDFSPWIKSREIVLAEYWKKTMKPDTLLTLPSGNILLSDLPKDEEFKKVDERTGQILKTGLPPVSVLSFRKTEIPDVCQYITNGVEILETNPWTQRKNGRFIGTSIPIYPFVGREMFIDEGGVSKRIYISMVRFTSWAIKGMAYARQLQIQLAQMTPKTPYMAIDGQLEGFTEQWKKIHTDPQAFVYYKAKLELYGEQLLPPPTRVPYEPAIQALEMLHAAFERDLQGALGMFRASVGDQRGNQSGKMVQELDKQSDQGSFHFTHNFNQTLERLWTDINELSDIVYDTTKRQVGGTKADGSFQPLNLNDPDDPESLHMGRGSFLTTVSIGPAMEAQNEDARKLVENILHFAPQAFDKIGHLLVRMSSTGPIVDEIVKILTPAGMGEDVNPAQLAQQAQQAAQMVEALKAELDKALIELKTKKFETDSKERIELLKIEGSLVEAKLKADYAAAQAEYDALIGQLNALEGERRANEAADADHERAKDMAVTQAALEPKPEPAAGAQQ